MEQQPLDLRSLGESLVNEVAEPFRFTFEVAWEVANKVGGIYTVIRTKAQVTTAELGDQYCMVGPYNESCVRLEVEVMEPEFSVLKEVIASLRSQGFKVVFGRWLIDGYPKVVLFDLGSAYSRLDQWRKELWDLAHIGIPDSDQESRDAIVFGNLVYLFVSEFMSRLPGPSPLIVGHFHEWLTGVGLLLLRLRQSAVATIFTTHATLLGRYLCAANIDFYNNLPHVSSYGFHMHMWCACIMY